MHQLQQQRFADTLLGLAHYKQHLQQQGVINQVTDLDVAGQPHFDEVEALRLIPMIITQEELHQIGETDRMALAKVYGSIWPLIVDEAERRRTRRSERTEMDSVLRSILKAQQVRKYGDKHAVNRRSSSSSSAGAWAMGVEPFSSQLAANWDEMNVHVEPSQRILKMAAVLIQEQKAERQRANKRPRQVSKKLIKAMREAAKVQRRMRAEIAAMATRQPVAMAPRTKRSLSGDDGSLEEDLNDGQISMLRSLMGDDGEDDYDDYSDNYLEELEEQQQVDEPHRQTADPTEDYDDYAFDMTHALVEDDDALLRRMYGTPRRSHKNDGSILELFKLAAKHRRRAERNSD